MASVAGSTTVPVHRLTVEDVIAMVEAGILPEHARVELEDGVLVEMVPIDPDHSGHVEWLTRHLVRGVPDDLRVRVQDTFLLPGGDYYEPDLMVIDAGGGWARAAHLIVEVAVSSRARDVEKARGYARAGVTEYWIVDPGRREVVVHRKPGPDGFSEVVAARDGEALQPPFAMAPVAVTAMLDPD